MNPTSWQRGSLTLRIECTDQGAPSHLEATTYYFNGRPGVRLRPRSITTDLSPIQIRALIAFLRAALYGSKK